MTIAARPGTQITQFHYEGITVDLDPQWSADWYEARLEQFLNDPEYRGWGWFWLNQRAGLTFRFRAGHELGYAFTIRDYQNLSGGGTQIIDPAIAN